MTPKAFPSNEEEEYIVFGSRRIYMMVLLYKVVGVSNTIILPQIAFTTGVMSTIVYLTLSYVFLGIPMMCMELTISQFTGRDCIDIWKIRPCLSHIGYFVRFWQFVTLTYHHVIDSLLLHYLIISFESPPLYSQCGYWSTKSCNILKFNQTANFRCLGIGIVHSQECEFIYTTYPEYQYYVFNLFGGKKYNFLVNWPLIVSSTVIIIIIFVNCFKRITSLKWFIYPISCFPLCAYMLLLIVSMRQKGFITYFSEIIDVDFIDHMRHRNPVQLILQTLYNLGAGSGVLSDFASLAPFRSPCFSNAVSAVLASTSFSLFGIIAATMMVCPYIFEYGGNPELFLTHPISFTFIKLPRMLAEFENGSVWISLAFSCHCVSGISNNIAIVYACLETAAKKSERIKKNTALATFLLMFVIFILTIPIISLIGREIISVNFRKYLFLVTIYFALLETIVFMVFYGFDKFYEDVHFMQGIQPRAYMKVSWMLLPFFLAYIFFQCVIEAIQDKKTQKEMIGFMLMIFVIISPVLIVLVKLLWAVWKKKLPLQWKLDETWGPRGDVLRRSRAMFTAHAMTKEYMYRQHHLQAGIVGRQRLSNARICLINNTPSKYY